MKVINCLGVRYEVVSMPGDGRCGYSCLAYALTGNHLQYVEVVEDLVKAFYANPHLFIQQTEFARKNDNLSQYNTMLRHAISKRSVPSLFWLEDAHLVAFSLMFDVTVYVFDAVRQTWYSYGHGAQKGYICLLSSGAHFDVLKGIRALKPAVPERAEKQGLNRETMVWNPVAVDVEKYGYSCVSKWDGERVELVNSNSSSSPLRCTYADVVRFGSTISVNAASESVVITHHHQDSPITVATVDSDGPGVSMTKEYRAGVDCEMEPVVSVESDSGLVVTEESGINVAKVHVSGVEGELDHAVICETESVNSSKNGTCVEKQSGAGSECDYKKDVQCKWSKVNTKISCEVCSKIFKSTRALNIHMTKMHKQPHLNEANKLPSKKCKVISKSNNTEITTFKCLFCDRSFVSKKALLFHIRRIHKYLDSDDDAKHHHEIDVEPDTEDFVNDLQKQTSKQVVMFCL